MLDQLNENGQILIGDVAFQKCSELEKCKHETGDECIAHKTPRNSVSGRRA